MTDIRAQASAILPATPEAVYGLLADYHRGHPAILPPKYFEELIVERGGTGAGTVIRFRARILGRTRDFRAEIEEPEPGQVLVERDLETGTRTSFTVEKGERPGTARLTIESRWSRPGIAGWIERILAPRLLKRIYTEELASIAEYLGRA
jgi:hypothetical protein